MKKIQLFTILGLLFVLLLAATQAFASSMDRPSPKNTPKPKSTPGEVATQKAEVKASQFKGKHEHLKGTVEAIDETSITLLLRDGSSETIGLSAKTRIKAPGMHEASIDLIQPGLQALVQAVRDQDGNLVARFLMLKPEQPSKVHRVGWVTDYIPGKGITIQAHDGNIYTFSLSEDVKILPQERAGDLAIGSRVTVIAPRNPSAGGMATGIVIHPTGSGAGGQPTAP